MRHGEPLPQRRRWQQRARFFFFFFSPPKTCFVPSRLGACPFSSGGPSSRRPHHLLLVSDGLSSAQRRLTAAVAERLTASVSSFPAPGSERPRLIPRNERPLLLPKCAHALPCGQVAPAVGPAVYTRAVPAHRASSVRGTLSLPAGESGAVYRGTTTVFLGRATPSRHPTFGSQPHISFPCYTQRARGLALFQSLVAR